MRTKVNVPRSGIAMSVILQGLFIAACAQSTFAAQAAQPAETGMLKLPNVRIQNATPTQIEAAAAQQSNAASMSGVRAYKDKETGHLRDQYPEELLEEAAASAAKPSQPAAIIAPVKGGIAALLDESYMTDAVATKDASGNLQWECVIGKDADARTLASGKAAKEHRHDR